MKKNSKTVANLKKQIDISELAIKNMKQKMVSNALSPEVMDEFQAEIDRREAEVESLRSLMADLESSEENMDDEARVLLAEYRSRLEAIELENKSGRGFIKVANFLQSKDAMKAFEEVVRNSPDSKMFRKNWEAKLIANGITPDDVMLPPTIIGEINDIWEDTATNFLSLLDITELHAYKVLYDTSAMATNTSRAQGHIKGEQKNEQIVPLAPKEIRAQYIYKYITLDRETVDYEDTTGALIRFINRELAYRIYHEIMRAVLVGDGRGAGVEGKIDKFEPVTGAGATYTNTTTAAGAKLTIEEAAAAVDSIEADGRIIAFMSKATARALRTYTAAAGGTTTYRPMDELADQLGVDEIRTTRILDEPGMPLFIAFVGKAYKVVGDLTMRSYENFILSYNKNEYLKEVYAGGALGVPMSAAVVNPA